MLASVDRGAGVLKGGHDYAKRQQRRQPDGQLGGRNELDDGSGSDLRGDTCGNSRSSLFVVRQRGKLRDAVRNWRDPLLLIRIGEEHVEYFKPLGLPLPFPHRATT